MFYADAVPTTPEMEGSLAVPHLAGGMSSKREVIGELVKEVFVVENVSPDEDLFALGMDSIHVLQLARKIQNAFRSQVEPQAIQRHASISALESIV